MITPPSAENQTQDQSTAVSEPGFEDAIQSFWAKNRSFILIGCIGVLLAIVGREGWQYYTAGQEQDIRTAYARTADRPEQLAAFANTHSAHVLAGVAYLQIADAKYAAADYRGAEDNYSKAMGVLKNPALLGRAKIGAAMSQLYQGNKTGGEAALAAISADTTLDIGVRAEGTYHLAALAFEAGNVGEVSRLVAEIGKIDATGVWSQRATSLLTVKAQ